MKLREFWKKEGIKEFTKKCLMNESIYDYKGSIKIVEEYWESSKDIIEFTQKVLNDKRLENNQGYWELVREQRASTRQELILNYLDERAKTRFTTYSDIGSISIGTDEFRYNIPNNFGDGTNYVYVLPYINNLSCLKYETLIKGKFNVYDYDLGDNIAISLEGEYRVYRGQSIIAFVENVKK